MIGHYRGFTIYKITDDKYTVEHDKTGGNMAPVVSFLQAVHAIDHYLDRSCKKHAHRKCPGQFRAGAKLDRIILDELVDFRLTDV